MFSIHVILVGLFVLFSLIVINFRNPNNIHRRLNYYIPPIQGEYTDYSEVVKPIQETSHRTFLTSITKIFEQFSINLNFESPTDSIKTFQDLVVDPTNLHINSTILEKISGPLNGMFAQPAEEVDWQTITREGRRVEDLVDIVIIFNDLISTASWIEFLESWKPLISKMTLIIIQQGDISHHIEIPPWVDYVLFNSDDVQKTLGSSYSWLIEMNSSLSSASARSFGMMVADRDFVYFLDPRMRPVLDDSGHPLSPFEDHLLSLLTPANPYYYNTLYDPYRKGSEFSRGYPHTLKEGIPTALSLGRVQGHYPLDAYSRLVKEQETQSRPPEVAQTIPYGPLFSLSMLNTMVYRKMAGPCMYFPSPAALHGLQIGDQNIEILTGWVCKVALDHVRGGIKHGGTNSVNVSFHSHWPSPSSQPLDPLFQELAGDLIWASCCSEQVLRVFAEMTGTLSTRSQVTTQDTVREIGERLASAFQDSPNLKEVFQSFSKGLIDYFEAWNALHAFKPSLTPIASRSSWMDRKLALKEATIKTPAESLVFQKYPHNCAAFTIVRHEPIMLPIWERYYSRHFPGSIFVLHHMLNVSTTTRKSLRGDMSTTPSSSSPSSSSPSPFTNSADQDRVVHWELFGDPHGFPVHFLAFIASVYQQRFFRAGFSCVLYTDVDEIIAPDPRFYPEGLSQFVYNFVSNSSQPSLRALGHTMTHVSESLDSSPALEDGPLDWSKPLLSQRSFWQRTTKYDKPLLSKTVLKWKPGFHTAFFPPVIEHDPNLHLLHLTEIDKDFCLQREALKGEVFSTLGHKHEIDGAFNGHILDYKKRLSSGELCRLARAAYYPDRNAALDFKGAMELERMDPAWRTVDI